MTGLVGLGLGGGGICPCCANKRLCGRQAISLYKLNLFTLRVQKTKVHGQGCSEGLLLDEDQDIMRYRYLTEL